ncbi:MAG: hypothetical protein ACXWT0_01710 [Methylobacter sp.]
MRITNKQIALLAAIRKGGDNGEFTDLDQILANLDYDTTKQSLQFSLRALIKRGWAIKHEQETRRKQSRRVISLTALGYDIAAARCKTD